VLPHIVGEEFTPHWTLDLSNEEYHRDKSALSSSSLKKLLKSPKSFYSYATGEQEFKETDAMRLGTLFHMALLEPELFKKKYVLMPDFGDMRSPKNRQTRDEWKANQAPDAVILSEEEKTDIIGMINSVARHRDAARMLKNGQSEISGFFRDPTTGMKCKIRPDFFLEKDMALMDVKTTEDCSLEAFSRTLWSYRYDVQMAMYCEGIRMITGKAVVHPMYLVIERKPPYECAVYRCDEGLIARGMTDYLGCLDLLKNCLDTNKWPGYQSQIQDIALPRWAFSNE
jgi:hypothetical protein